jgi:hypothetical protein
MKWNKIHDFLNDLIDQKPRLEVGYILIKEFLKENDTPFVELDMDTIHKDFFLWLNTVLRDNPIPSSIKGIYFGLRSMKLKNDAKNQYNTTIHLCGSKFSPDEDNDWASSADYIPTQQYVQFGELEKLDLLIRNHHHLKGQYEVLVFVGILILLVQNTISMKVIKNKLLTSESQKNILVGVGYDSGDVYLIGER